MKLRILIGLVCWSAVVSLALGDSSSPADSYSQGMALFQARHYSQALPWFEKAVQEQPGGALAYYYLGSCQYQTGDKKSAAVNFYLSDEKKSNPALKKFADDIKYQLSPEDQKWVDDQSTFAPAAQSELLAPGLPVLTAHHFGVRLNSGLLFFKLDDFQSFLATLQTMEAQTRLSYPYFVGLYSVPWMAFVPEVNPFYTLGSNLELGLGLSAVLLDPIYYHFSDIAANFYDYSDYSLEAFGVFLKGRWYPLGSAKGDLAVYLEPGLGWLPVQVTYHEKWQNASGLYSTNDIGARTTSSALGAQLRAGAALKLGESFQISFSTGYQIARAAGFKGTSWDEKNPPTNGQAGSLRVYHSPLSGKDYVIFMPDDPSRLGDFGESQITLDNSRPLVVDLSGFQGNFELAFLF